MQIVAGSDDTMFIKESIKEVWRTFAVAATLVVLVIYLCSGQFARRHRAGRRGARCA
jgi:multidrug efflux pump